MISCSICKSEFQEAENGLAYRCAAIYEDGNVTGYYGSTVIDCEVWKMLKMEPSIPEGSIVCDNCITIRIRNKTMILKRRSEW
jgi:hypothetical protein